MTNKKKPYHDFITAVHNEDTIGYPMTPGHWDGKETYETVTKVEFCGGGYQPQFYIAKNMELSALKTAMENNQPLEVNTYDGKKIVINPHYIIKMEQFTMVSRSYYSENPSYTKGSFVYRWLLPLNKKVQFVNEYRYYV